MNGTGKGTASSGGGRRRGTRRGQPPPEDGRRRVVVERVLPAVNGGRFPVKRTVGEHVDVIAYVHADGHDILAVVLRDWRSGRGASLEPREQRMVPLGNDEWRGRFRVDHVGEHLYTVEAWIDRFESWRHGLEAKAAAGQDVSLDLQEGGALVAAAAERSAAVAAADASPDRASDRAELDAAAAVLNGSVDHASRIQAALDEGLRVLMARYSDRSLAASFEPPLGVTVDRARARVGAWYEMFPRSWGGDGDRSATLREAADHLRNVAAMEFDVVYLPPIHPIGSTFRKGKGNRLVADPGDPGSPWAIGGPEGGHTSVHPELGTLDDFDHFVATARGLGLEVALDIAFQASPDHPWVREHPEWFRHRPDGSIKYAENPPKRYQDIYPFDFESRTWRELWTALCGVVRFWIGHGVNIFRVDNPHTKPYAFWEWLIADIRRDHADVIFLSEAFTRPKVMYYLAKIGFTQSYTYFTWRNSKAELRDYFTELTQTEVREYFRPNLFANTPDILHAFLQQGGPAAFRVRAVLAATLGASYGIYSGFELCESQAVEGSEEYLHSEKYQIRRRDWGRTEGITDLVTRLNRVRRDNHALHFDWGLRFHDCDSPQIVAYSKTSPDEANVVLVVVNLDPHHRHEGQVFVPPLPGTGGGRFAARELLTGAVYDWREGWNYVRLDPACPAHVLRVEPIGPWEPHG